MKITIEAANLEELKSLLEQLTAADKKAVPEEEIDSLDLSVRATNCLKSGGIFTIEKLRLTPPNELLKIPRLGQLCLYEIEVALAALDSA